MISNFKPENPIFHRVLRKSFKPIHITHDMIDRANQCNMIHLAVWWKEDMLLYEENRICLKDHPNCILYVEGCYDTNTGKYSTVIDSLQSFYGFDFQQSYYIANFFMKQVIKDIMRNYVASHYPNLVDLPDNAKQAVLDIIKENQFQKTDSNSKTRAYAYLINQRGIDRDWITHFIDQGYLAMDRRNNLCFITYENEEPVAITKVGTIPDKRFVQNHFAKRNAGFQYIKKTEPEIQNVFVFESCIELMSYLTLIKLHLVPAPPRGSAYLVLAELNVNCLIRFLYYHPQVKTIYCCVKDHMKYSSVMNKIYRMKDLEIKDMRSILCKYSFNYTYVHDWNCMLCHHLGIWSPPPQPNDRQEHSILIQ